MEVVEAAAAQLETLKFSGTSLGLGESPTVPSSDSARTPAPQSNEGCPESEQAVEAHSAGQQPPQPAQSAEAGGSPAPQPAGAPRGACVTGPATPLPAQTPSCLETSDSDSDRSSFPGPRNPRRGPWTGGGKPG